MKLLSGPLRCGFRSKPDAIRSLALDANRGPVLLKVQAPTTARAFNGPLRLGLVVHHSRDSYGGPSASRISGAMPHAEKVTHEAGLSR